MLFFYVFAMSKGSLSAVLEVGDGVLVRHFVLTPGCCSTFKSCTFDFSVCQINALLEVRYIICLAIEFMFHGFPQQKKAAAFKKILARPSTYMNK